MQKYQAIMALLFLTGVSCTKIAVDSQDYDESVITNAQSKSIFRECQDLPNNTQVSMALIDSGQVIFYGIKRENDTIFTYHNHESVFEVGSISKVFTATILADFVLNKKVDLDDPISDYIKTPIRENIEITFKQLANHTSGLPRLPSNMSLLEIDLKNPYKDYDEVKLEEYLSQQIELENPGRFEYSNLGAGLLGFTLAKIEKTTYEDLLQNRIFSKYQMTGSSSIRNLVSAELVAGLNPKGTVTPNWDLNVLVGAGGILSSVEDLSRFATAQFEDSNEVLSLTRKSTYRGHHNGAEMSIGLGWMINTRSGKESVWHNGATGGYSAFMQVDIENRNAVIILTNISGISSARKNVDSLGGRLMDSLSDEITEGYHG